jgi:hypothetical protein
MREFKDAVTGNSTPDTDTQPELPAADTTTTAATETTVTPTTATPSERETV